MDMFDVKELLFFLITLVLMGFFAGIEMAFYSVNRLNIELKRKQGNSASRMLSEYFEKPVSFLGATLIGFNIFLVFFTLEVHNVMRPIWRWLQFEHISALQLVIEILLSTFVVILFAEFIPRAIFRSRSNSLLHFLVYVINFFYQMFAPVANALIRAAEWILKYLFNIRLQEEKEPLGQRQLEHIFNPRPETTDEDEELNKELIENALELPKVRIRQCLVPRKEIIGLDISSTMQEIRRKFVETKLSKLIIYEENIDHIAGYIHQLDLFKKPETIQSVLLPIPAVPESMSATDLITKFSNERKSIAWVVDEFGGTAGIITMEDVLEEVFGEIRDEYDIEEFVEKRIAENEYIFSGRLELDYLNQEYGLSFPPSESETLSGYIINYHETIPRQKERIIIENYEFDILNVSDTRIEMVKLKILK